MTENGSAQGSCCLTRDFGLLVLRLAAGGMMMTHGIQKIQGWAMLTDGISDNPGGNYEFNSVLGIGAVPELAMATAAEAGAAALVVLGLWTRLSAIPVVFTMAVAVYVHASTPGMNAFSQMELAIFYGAAFLAIALAGPGKFSLDHVLKGKVPLACP